MGGRDDFGPRAVDEMRKRVAYRCSAPSCRVSTIGPSDSRKGRVSNVGVAAHITAAAAGGPRYDAGMSSAERGSETNGIWLCAVHAKLIDDNEDRFTVKLLKEWKRAAEKSAWREMDRGGADALLLDHSVVVPGAQEDGPLREAVLAFFDDCGAAGVWKGGILSSVRLLAYEVLLNSFRHGGAGSVLLRSRKGVVHIEERGVPFGPRQLLAADGRGGRASLESFRAQCDGRLELTYRHDGGANRWAVVDLSRNLGHHHPCALRLRPRAVDEGAFARLAGCEEVHLYVERNGMLAFSDVARLARELVGRLPDRCYVFHGVEENSGLRDYIAAQLSHVRFVPA